MYDDGESDNQSDFDATAHTVSPAHTDDSEDTALLKMELTEKKKAKKKEAAAARRKAHPPPRRGAAGGGAGGGAGGLKQHCR